MAEIVLYAKQKYDQYFMRLCTTYVHRRGTKIVSQNRETQFNFVLKLNKMSQSTLSRES